MITIHCYNRTVQSFFMEVEISQPLYINGVPVRDLYLEKYPGEGHLYINGVRARQLPSGSDYQLIEPTLLGYFNEICQLFTGNADIDVEDELYLPVSIQINGKRVFKIERTGTIFTMDTELGLDDIRHISDRVESVFRVKVIPLLRSVGLYG